jgi:OOP family OmpA-OmpF porin
MRCNWRRWLWGIIPLLVLSWVALQAEHSRIENDLTERARQALTSAGFPWALTEFKGRDVVLTGRAPQEGDPSKAADALGSLWGVRVVDNKAGLLEKADKYVWSASRRNNRIRLTGYAPSLGARQAILGVTRASFPGFEIIDRTTLARGVGSSDVWLAGVSFALKQLASLKRGDVRLEDLNLSVMGEAEDIGAYRALKAALAGTLPKGIKLAADIVAAPAVSPYTWSALLADGRLVLSGYVPGDAARAELLAAVRGALPDVTVVDRMQPGEGAPQGFTSATAASIRELARLQGGGAEIKDAVLAVFGIAESEAAAEATRNVLRASLPGTFRFVDQIRAKELPPPPALAAPPAKGPEAQAPGVTTTVTPPTAPPALPTALEIRAKACEDNLRSLAAAGQIRFLLASAKLDGASFDTLDKLAQAAKSCPGMRIEVAGHASAEGDPELNQRLSVQRAQSVVAYLVDAGVGAEQLEAVGYGSTRPIASNDTEEEMAKNRRIEFSVRPK